MTIEEIQKIIGKTIIYDKGYKLVKAKILSCDTSHRLNEAGELVVNSTVTIKEADTKWTDIVKTDKVYSCFDEALEAKVQEFKKTFQTENKDLIDLESLEVIKPLETDEDTVEQLPTILY